MDPQRRALVATAAAALVVLTERLGAPGLQTLVVVAAVAAQMPRIMVQEVRGSS
jgi:hypothetical protein